MNPEVVARLLDEREAQGLPRIVTAPEVAARLVILLGLNRPTLVDRKEAA